MDEKIAARGRLVGLLGTIGSALIAAWAALAVASGKKANQDNPTNFVGDVYSGVGVIYRLANPNVPLAQVFPQKPRSSKNSATPAPVAIPSPVPSGPPATQLHPIQALLVLGLTKNSGPYRFPLPCPSLPGQNKGYTVHLRFRNISNEQIGLTLQGQAEMTDNAGNKLGLQSSSIAVTNQNVAPTAFAAGVDGPANFQFQGPASHLGTLVDFDVSLRSSTVIDGKPVNQQITVGCTGLPVSSSAGGADGGVRQ